MMFKVTEKAALTLAKRMKENLTGLIGKEEINVSDLFLEQAYVDLKKENPEIHTYLERVTAMYSELLGSDEIAVYARDTAVTVYLLLKTQYEANQAEAN